MKKKSWWLLRKMSMPELVSYRKKEREELLNIPLKKTEHILKLIVHPFLLFCVFLFHKIKKIKVVTNGYVPKTNRSIIFAATHIGMYDVEIIMQAIKKHMYFFSGDEDAMYRTLDGFLFDVNGVIYLDVNDKKDKKIALETAIKYLVNGRSLLWYPEGIWNLHSNYVVLPIHTGIIKAAFRSNSIIIPIGIEQYDKANGIEFVVNIGEEFDVRRYYKKSMTKDNEIKLAELLRSEMAKLKIDAWENVRRDTITLDYWPDFLAKRLSEWPHYNIDIIRQREFNPYGYISSEEVYSTFANISIGKNNAFLAKEQFFLKKKNSN